MNECKCGCGEDVASVPGKAIKLFYSDSCRKRYARTATPDTTATPDSPTPDKSTPDTNSGQLRTDSVCGRCAGQGCPACSADCMHVRQAKASGKGTQVNTGPWIPAHDLARGQVNRVALPGDADYV